MSDKDGSNLFKFSLFQENNLFYENTINANLFNPLTRYSINIRSILPVAISKLQNVLSKKKYDTLLEVGYNKSYDLYEYYSKKINSYPKRYQNDMVYNPQTVVQQIDEKTIKGVECKIGFYINDKPIVERVFYVDRFNPVSRLSIELKEAMEDITEAIFNQIKKDDIRNMWDDYDLINIKGFNINQIREFNSYKRTEILKSMKLN